VSLRSVRVPVRDHVRVASLITVVHTLSYFLDLQVLVFASGLLMAFYVPGSLIVYGGRRGPIIPRHSITERLSLAALLSVAYVAVVALGLNYTPWGISHGSLIVCLWATVAIAAMVELWYERGNDPA
jgi:uncharacterized membrane protein